MKFIIMFWIFLIIDNVVSYLQSDTSELLNQLLSDYDKRIRPYADDGVPVKIDMTIVLGILTEIRENQQVASFVISHYQKWQDPKLTWDPSEYGNIKQIVIPQSYLWVPKLFIYNSMDTKDMLGENKYDVRVQHTGHVKLNIPQFVTCICRLSIELFPFDTQFCAIALASPLMTTSELKINVTDPPPDTYFSGNAEWLLLDVTVRNLAFTEDGEERPEILYIISLKRRPIYYLTVIVAPTFLISALSILGIFSPGTNDGPRNEKVSLGLGSLLAMTVLLDIVAGAMPKSNSIPLLGYYIIAVIILCAVAVAVSMALLALSRHFIQTQELPSSFAYRVLWMMPKRRPVDYWETDHSEEETKILLPKYSDLIAIYNQVRHISIAQIRFRKKLEKQQMHSLIEKEWNKLFSRFDFFFLFIFQLLNLIILALFLRNAYSPTPSVPDDFAV
uniref:Neur_chan_LBD domain-containing protein n=1 Tax=Strongyloides stercoralis TaxID=6248 RepID=A0A0K0EJU8_STRER